LLSSNGIVTVRLRRFQIERHFSIRKDIEIKVANHSFVELLFQIFAGSTNKVGKDWVRAVGIRIARNEWVGIVFIVTVTTAFSFLAAFALLGAFVLIFLFLIVFFVIIIVIVVWATIVVMVVVVYAWKPESISAPLSSLLLIASTKSLSSVPLFRIDGSIC
jgi:hypothetical protein